MDQLAVVAALEDQSASPFQIISGCPSSDMVIRLWEGSLPAILLFEL